MTPANGTKCAQSGFDLGRNWRHRRLIAYGSYGHRSLKLKPRAIKHGGPRLALFRSELLVVVPLANATGSLVTQAVMRSSAMGV